MTAINRSLSSTTSDNQFCYGCIWHWQFCSGSRPKPVSAQNDTGSLVGSIQDSTGAEVPGATITVLNKNTAAVFTTTTGSTGEYEAPSLAYRHVQDHGSARRIQHSGGR